MNVYKRVRQFDDASGRVVDVSSKEIPERWAKRLIEKGFTDRRSTKEPKASMSALAERLGVHTSTISNAINGRNDSDASTVNGLVRELGPDVAEWLGVQYFGAWVPPESSTLLSPRHRAIIEALITSITLEEEVSGHGKRPAKKTSRARGTGSKTGVKKPEDPQ